ncbi:DUF192 domain-containing protein [Streptomyces asiaticus]
MVRLAAASLAGTAIEFYDFFVYGTAAALVLGPLFFPTFSPLAGTLAAFGTFGVGFVSRPLGSMLFGPLGDRHGRRPVLIASLMLTGLATVAVGFVPTYDSIGIAAPVLLLVLRFLQGLGLGGEWGGAGRAEGGAGTGRAESGARRAEGIPLTIAASYRARARGLLGRDGLTGALLLTPASGVHTFRMRFAIDVAYLDRHLTVLDVHTLRPGRLGRPRLRSRHVLEAEAGALEHWGVRRGVRVVIAPGPSAPPSPSVR